MDERRRVEVLRHLREGVRLWHEGAPHPAHEEWESAWKLLEPPDKGLAQALVQLAAARVKRAVDNETGVKKLLAKARANLSAVAEVKREVLGLDVADLEMRVGALEEVPSDARLAALLGFDAFSSRRSASEGEEGTER